MEFKKNVELTNNERALLQTILKNKLEDYEDYLTVTHNERLIESTKENIETVKQIMTKIK